ncbi:hypothetical protein F5Y06DRAFT_296903 [Hypoxylon sp. FL0890]|nr:hypothetical protein F5Y06DRAFT_296903 [Hypoxylon sp. FL0890]
MDFEAGQNDGEGDLEFYKRETSFQHLRPEFTSLRHQKHLNILTTINLHLQTHLLNSSKSTQPNNQTPQSKMQFTNLLAAAAALAFSANASPIGERDGARLAQFRVYGADGCHDLNMGFYTVDASDSNTCKTFTGTTGPVKSLNLEAQYSPAANGCIFFIYTDETCTAGRRAIGVDSCQDGPDNGTWGSWQIFCPSGNAGN